MDLSFLPPEAIPALQMVGGAVVFIIGAIYAYKFFQAAIFGKVNYWAGLEQFGWYFAPLTTFITPLFCFTPDNGKSLIRTRHAAWVHLLWSPVFFLLGLAFMVAGADFMGLPGSSAMNAILTLGRNDVPPAITYAPPFSYKFPFLKKVRKSLFKLVTTDIPWDKKNALLEEEMPNADKPQPVSDDDDSDETKPTQ
ncbi:MAG: hypothetical protein K2W82_13150 [Candidatus Obscuribacterales bacterium]|nr:hypothetical protein [Candidatus Obscuribacterales bacterium]